jgi:cytochrome c
MNKFLATLIISLSTATIGSAAFAADRSTDAQANALLAKAQKYIVDNGIEKAHAEFNKLDSPFNVKSDMNPNGDLYVYIILPDGTQPVHGKNVKIQGKKMIDMKDADGVPLIKELADKCFATKEKKGSVKYRWPHPVTKELEAKKGIVEIVPGHQQCIGTGVYQ